MTMAKDYFIEIGQPETNYARGGAVFHPFTSASDPQARSFPGLSDLQWFESNPTVLSQFRGQWAAIRNRRVIASAPSAREVYDDALSQGCSDPLIVEVLADPTRWDNLIA